MAKPKCFGYYAECPSQVPDGLSDNKEILYWKIDCPQRNECFLDWKNSGGRLGYMDIKLLEGK